MQVSSMRLSRLRVWPLALLLLVTACARESVYFEEQTMGDEGWPADAPAEFAFDVPDTTQAYQLDFVLRHGDEYPNANVYLFVTVLSPQGAQRCDTLNYRVADDRGAWLGKSFAGEREVRLPYAEEVRFAEPGVYTVRVQQGMRYQTLPGVRRFALQVQLATQSSVDDGQE